MAQPPKPVRLKPETLGKFDDYIGKVEAQTEQTQNQSFLWSDLDPERSQRIHNGETVAQFWSGRSPVKAPDGLIHDWIAATFLADTSLADTLALIQDYDNHKIIYKPEVVDSKLICRQGNDFQIYLRLLKKKIITVVLDTDHDVHYTALDPIRWTCHSRTTRIAEVENPGSPEERVLPPDSGYGFLWRLYSYWNFEERGGGVALECRAISLTRDVPFGLGWAIEPMIQKLPKESLIHTLEATRRALQARVR